MLMIRDKRSIRSLCRAAIFAVKLEQVFTERGPMPVGGRVVDAGHTLANALDRGDHGRQAATAPCSL